MILLQANLYQWELHAYCFSINALSSSLFTIYYTEYLCFTQRMVLLLSASSFSKTKLCIYYLKSWWLLLDQLHKSLQEFFCLVLFAYSIGSITHIFFSLFDTKELTSLCSYCSAKYYLKNYITSHDFSIWQWSMNSCHIFVLRITPTLCVEHYSQKLRKTSNICWCQPIIYKLFTVTQLLQVLKQGCFKSYMLNIASKACGIFKMKKLVLNGVGTSNQTWVQS